MKYEMVAHSNTLDDILDKIYVMPKPIGIIVFGADSGLKEMIYREIIQKSKRLFGKEVRSKSIGAKYDSERINIKNGDDIAGVLIKMSGDESAKPGELNSKALGMRKEKGGDMESVVGIYAKFSSPRSSEIESCQSKIESYKLKLEEYPPEEGGFTAVVTITTQL